MCFDRLLTYIHAVNSYSIKSIVKFRGEERISPNKNDELHQMKLEIICIMNRVIECMISTELILTELFSVLTEITV